MPMHAGHPLSFALRVVPPVALVALFALSAAAASQAPDRSLDINGAWSKLPAVAPVSFAAAAFDPIGGRTIVFGGSSKAGPLSQTLEIRLAPTPVVRVLGTADDAAHPIARRASTSMVYDSRRQRMIVFGGTNGDGVMNDVQELAMTPGAGWTELFPLGTLPLPRAGHAAVYDSLRDRTLVFGGDDNQLWSLSLSDPPTWTQLAPAGPLPAARTGASMIYDPPNDRVILWGGYTGGVPNKDLWQLALSPVPTWTLLNANSRTDPGQGVAVYDGPGRRMIVCGGQGFGNNPVTNTYALPLDGTPTWVNLGSPAGAPSRYGHAAAFDPDQRKMVVFGGAWYDVNENLNTDFDSGAWTLALSGTPAWSTLWPSTPPPVSPGVFVAYDPLRDCLQFADPGYVALPPAGDVGYRGTFPLSTSASSMWGTGPIATYYEAPTAFDPRRDQTVTFGGVEIYLGTINYATIGRPLDGGTVWSMAPAVPLARWDHALLYDPRRDRMLCFGGQGVSGTYLNEVWSLSLDPPRTWTQVLPSGTAPPGRVYAAVAYDPVRDRMIVFAGSTSGPALNDLWALGLSGSPSWTHLFPTGTSPPAAANYQMIYDPVRDRMVVFNGVNTTALSLAGTPAWSTLATTGTIAVYGHRCTYDPLRDRLISVGIDQTIYDPYTHAFALTWGAPARPDAAPVPGNVLWTPGATLPVDFALTNGLGGPRAISWKLQSARTWPGLPMYGTAVVGGGSAQTVTIPVPVPDTAAVGTNALTLTAWYEGGLGNNATAVTLIGDGSLLGVSPVGARTALAIESPRPNPARRLRVSFTQPDGRPAVLAAYDVSGRCVARQVFAAAGRHTADLAERNLSPGVYLIRLSQGPAEVTTRAVLIR